MGIKKLRANDTLQAELHSGKSGEMAGSYHNAS